MTDWGLMTTIKKNEDSEYRNPRFSLLFNVFESISEYTYLLFRQSACRSSNAYSNGL